MYDFTNFKIETKKIEDWLRNEFLSIHTGRANPAVLDRVQVETYGARQPISNVASISTRDARTLHISPWDKTVIKDIEKAISASDLGLSVSVDDSGIYASFPELTSENRDILAKLVHQKLEDARVSVRKVREDVWDDIQEKEKNKEITEDDKFRGKDELQKLVDEANKSLEEIAKNKTELIKN